MDIDYCKTEYCGVEKIFYKEQNIYGKVIILKVIVLHVSHIIYLYTSLLAVCSIHCFTGACLKVVYLFFYLQTLALVLFKLVAFYYFRGYIVVFKMSTFPYHGV